MKYRIFFLVAIVVFCSSINAMMSRDENFESEDFSKLPIEITFVLQETGKTEFVDLDSDNVGIISNLKKNSKLALFISANSKNIEKIINIKK